MKRNFWVRTVNVLVIVALIAAYQMIAEDRQAKEAAAQEKAKQQQAEQRKASGAVSAFKDGTFDGSAEGYGGSIQTRVTISGGVIEKIDIVSASGEDDQYLSMARGVVDDILEKQSPDVDTVSGATYSSTGIINSVTDALTKAVAK